MIWKLVVEHCRMLRHERVGYAESSKAFSVFTDHSRSASGGLISSEMPVKDFCSNNQRILGKKSSNLRRQSLILYLRQVLVLFVTCRSRFLWRVPHSILRQPTQSNRTAPRPCARCGFALCRHRYAGR